MYVVALTRWGQPSTAYRGGGGGGGATESEVAELAPLLGLTVFDARLRLAGGLPIVVGRREDVAGAQGLLASLRQRGHGAVACDLEAVATSDALLCPKTFAFEPDAFVAEAPGGKTSVPYPQMLSLVRATHRRVEETTQETKSKKLSLGRSALTGGLVNTKTVTSTARSVSEELEQALYVFCHGGQGHLILRESSLRYAGLGARVARTTRENFELTVRLLREHAPSAHYDDRLVSQRRRGGDLSISGSMGTSTIASSNARETDLAAHLITVALLQGQL